LSEGEWRLDIAKGESVFVPARKGSVFLEGRGTFLLTTVPDEAL
jgi:mannose-6-phosphate isomerase class I